MPCRVFQVMDGIPSEEESICFLISMHLGWDIGLAAAFGSCISIIRCRLPCGGFQSRGHMGREIHVTPGEISLIEGP